MAAMRSRRCWSSGGLRAAGNPPGWGPGARGFNPVPRLEAPAKYGFLLSGVKGLAACTGALRVQFLQGSEIQRFLADGRFRRVGCTRSFRAQPRTVDRCPTGADRPGSAALRGAVRHRGTRSREAMTSSRCENGSAPMAADGRPERVSTITMQPTAVPAPALGRHEQGWPGHLAAVPNRAQFSSPSTSRVGRARDGLTV
jgi:hypothetical protein